MRVHKIIIDKGWLNSWTLFLVFLITCLESLSKL